jgi:hypothetical protein
VPVPFVVLLPVDDVCVHLGKHEGRVVELAGVAVLDGVQGARPACPHLGRGGEGGGRET